MLTTVPRDIAEVGTTARLRSCVVRERVVAARRDLISGERPETLHLLISGTAARYRVLGNGSRQITALILPGELCDLEDHVRGGSASAIATITACAVGEIPRAALFEGGVFKRDWADLAFETLGREAAVATEWIVSLGRRSAFEAMAHLFCEIGERMQTAGLSEGTRFPFGLTQVDLADVLGLTSVHVNRTLRDLRAAGLVQVRGKCVTILDPAGLRAAADFDPGYLHCQTIATTQLSRG